MSVFWVRCDKIRNFVSDYSQILRLLDGSGTNSEVSRNPTKVLAQVDRTLKDGPTSWILILDNADNLQMFRDRSGDGICINDYLPSRGRILLTTQDRRFHGEFSDASDGLEIKPMDDEQAITLLLNSVPDDLQTSEPSTVKTLIQELGNLLLAIAQAAANVGERLLSIDAYLHGYLDKKRRMELLSLPVYSPRSAPQSLLIAWDISFEYIEAQNPAAAEIICKIGLCHWDAVPSVLINGRSRDEFISSIGLLLNLCMISRSYVDMPETIYDGWDVYSAHPILHECMLRRLSPEQRKFYLRDMIGRLEVHYSVFVPDSLESDLSHYLPGRLFLPRALEILEHQAAWGYAESTDLRLLKMIATFTGLIGYYSTSHELGLRAIATAAE